MEEEEDWDAEPAPAAPKPAVAAVAAPPEQSGNAPSTPYQTLKITDGYKYSYEALASPANIDDWVDPPSYGGPKRANGYTQNSRDNDGRQFRGERRSNR